MNIQEIKDIVNSGETDVKVIENKILESLAKDETVILSLLTLERNEKKIIVNEVHLLLSEADGALLNVEHEVKAKIAIFFSKVKTVWSHIFAKVEPVIQVAEKVEDVVETDVNIIKTEATGSI